MTTYNCSGLYLGNGMVITEPIGVIPIIALMALAYFTIALAHWASGNSLWASLLWMFQTIKGGGCNTK